MLRKTIALGLVAILSGCGLRERNLAESATAQSFLASARADVEALADAQFTEKVEGRNVTAEFRAAFRNPDLVLTEERKQELRKYKVLLIHGLLGEVGLKFGGFLDKFNDEQRLIDYLKDQRNALRELGIDAEVVGFKSAAVDRSGTKVAKAIRESAKPVLLISHSKGGVDSLDALLKLAGDGQLSKVAGWISIQGVFFGSRDADGYVDNRFKSAMAHVAIKCLGGNYDAVRDLTTGTRERYQTDRRAEIDKIVGAVPILCFGSWDPIGKGAEDKDGDATIWTDGQVSPRSAVLPGTDYIAKCGVSHSMTVIHSSREYDRVAFTKALLGMLALRIASKSAEGGKN